MIADADFKTKVNRLHRRAQRAESQAIKAERAVRHLTKLKDNIISRRQSYIRELTNRIQRMPFFIRWFIYG